MTGWWQVICLVRVVKGEFFCVWFLGVLCLWFRSGRDSRDWPKRDDRCWGCGQRGHMIYACSLASDVDVTGKPRKRAAVDNA